MARTKVRSGAGQSPGCPNQRVQQRREELANMEIVVAEAPKLLNLALVEFRV